MRNRRGTRLIGALCLALSLGAAALAFSPVLILDVVLEGSGRSVWCAQAPASGEFDVRYVSRNSMYGARSEEQWLVDSGGIRIVRVRSAPIVLDYYGITDYRMLVEGTAEGIPVVARYPLLRIKASPRGEQRLITGAGQLDLSNGFAEGDVLIIQPRAASRFSPCAATLRLQTSQP